MALATLGTSDFVGNRFGDGELKVLALHGWGRDGTDFERVLAGHSGLSVHLPGFGSAPPPTSAWTPADYADALAPALSETPPVVLVGHSFGGRVAIRLAARHPDRVAALVLTGVPFVPRAGGKKPALVYRLARLAHRVGIVSENKMESLRQRYGSLDYRNAEGVMRQVLVAAIGEDYFEDAARITQPVTMVWGENDQPAPLAGAQQALEHFSNATVRVVPGAGHLLEGTLEAELRDALAHALHD